MSAPRIPARRLPRQPNLEQLRKQARELQARQPGWRLSAAQRALARSYGFDTWTKLKAFVDGANVARLAEAIQAGDLAAVRQLVKARPELVGIDRAADDEHRALHYAVLRRDREMVRVLMQAGADARQGIFPHRDATSALALARDREYPEIVAAIEEEEQRRRESRSGPNAGSPEQDRIQDAIRRGDDAAARAVLEADQNRIHACDRHGGTPLHAAAEAGSVELVEWLLARQATPRKPDSQGWTPLDRAALAADSRFPEVAQRLLAGGATLTLPGALALGDPGRVRQLVGADTGVLRRGIDWRRGGLLSLAVRHGRPEMVRLLLDLGADVDERTTLVELEEPTESWGLPLWLAAAAGRYDIAELLLDRGADPNANPYASGWPIDHAYRRGDGALKQLLLERGARPRPWTVALAHDVEAARRMLAADGGEEVARELTWSAACNGCPEIVELALPRLPWERGDPRWNWILIQPPRSAGDDGAEEPYFRSMELLLERIDPNVSARFGQTALHFVAARGSLSEPARVRFTEMLLDRGARVDLRDELLRSTPLGWACRWGRGGMVEVLLARGARAEETDAEAWATPRAWARKMGHEDLLRLLGG